ncbi:MAG: hypothetical protein M3O70_08685 [Actinomycetota bacterium]|nr:hypothetical protein [Actinomycetota bacterium]
MKQRGREAEAVVATHHRVDGQPDAPGDGRPSTRAWVSGGALTLVIYLVTLPGLGYVPSGGLDPSYRAAVHMALDRGVGFGGEIVHNFGPLGFLGAPTAYDPTTYPIAAVVALGLQLALVAAIVALLLRAFGTTATGLLLTALGAFVVARIASRLLHQLATPELLTLLLVVACLELLRRSRPTPQRAQLCGLAVLAAAAALVKFNTSAVTLTAVGVTSLALPATGPALRMTVQRLSAVAVGAIGGVVGLWLVTGQQLPDLLPFLRDSLEISAGHIEAMAAEDVARRWEYLAALLVLALLAAAVLSATRELTWRTRLGTFVVLGVYAAALLRHGFVRHDAGHSPLFFLPLMIVALVWLPMGKRALNLAAATVATLVSLAVVAGMVPLRPTVAGTHEAAQALAAVVPSRQAQVVAQARERMRREYGLSGEAIALLSGRTVHVQPWETALLWAYPEFRWGPVPIFQSYVAYTAELDQRNAELLASPDAPEFVLQEVAYVDGRNQLFDPPAHMLALVCHYEQVRDDGRWQVLERVDNRCGAPEAAGRESLPYGNYSDTPQVDGGELLVARFHRLDAQPWDRLRGFVLKPRTLNFRGQDPDQSWRFVQGHATSPHVVDPPDCLRWAARFLPGQPFDVLALHPTGNPAPAFPGGYTVSYERIPFSCPATS